MSAPAAARAVSVEAADDRAPAAVASRIDPLRADRGAWIAFLAVIAFPLLPFVPFSLVGNALVAAQFALAAVSLVVLVGWVGQISLGHAGLVGVGAYVGGYFVGGLGIGFPLNVVFAAGAGAVVSAVLGVVALRVRGLYLAVATLVFSWMADEFLFRQEWFTRHSEIEVPATGTTGQLPYFDWNNQRTIYFAAWFLVALVVYLCANMRSSKTGRAFSAVRGSEVAAASLGISVVRTKLLAFSVSGAIAAAAGALTLISQRAVVPDQFGLRQSLMLLSIVVVGGLASLGGAVAASWIFAGINELFFRFPIFSGYLDVVSAVLLAFVLLVYPGGLAALATATGDRLRRARGAFPRLPVKAPVVDMRPFRDRTARWLARAVPFRIVAVRPETNGKADHTAANGSAVLDRLVAQERSAPVLPAAREDRAAILEASGITVRFGGLTAAEDVTLAVREGEIVGLIGPNGAGKTTVFNSIAGLNVPTAGTVRISGEDVTSWSVDRRARLGIGRTFQAPQLLPHLTVFENLVVATDIRNGSSFWSHLIMGPKTIAAEVSAQRDVLRVARLLELEEHLHRPIADLPFGILRMVELARALVAGAHLIMLDEPASGLDDLETDKLAGTLRSIRSMGITLLLIEHDVRLVTSLCDYIYVLERGRLLAEGEAAVIQNDPRVIQAYLGTSADEQPKARGRKRRRVTFDPTATKDADPCDARGLSVRDLCVSYGPVQALRGVSLHVAPGERVALLGANGAGKTSILRAISGLVPIASGDASWRGESVTASPGHRLPSRGIAHLPEGRELFPTLTVEENLRLGHWSRREDKADLDSQLDRVMQHFPRLRERRRQTAKTLSGGEQQMLGMARALMSSPALLLVDEMSLGLAPKVVEDLFEILESVNRDGTAVLLVEQFVNMALRHTDRAYVLAKGQVVLSGPSSELLEAEELIESYLGEAV